MPTLLERYSNVIVVALAALLAAAVVALILDQREGSAPLEIDLAERTPAGPVEVYITGAVAQPGVYEIADGERVVDLLYKAGGPAPDANLEGINLAVRLHDEDQVIVPRIGQASSVSQVAGTTSRGLVNINTATAAELDALPGIGEVYSQRIVDSRAAGGLFTTTDELVERRIIPNATYEKIRDLISVGP